MALLTLRGFKVLYVRVGGLADFSAEECWQGVCFNRTAGCPSQGVGWVLLTGR